MASIKIWMNVKSHLRNERRVPGSEKLTALDLQVYRAAVFSKIENFESVPGGETGVFMVGDAAFGVPFFRALNAGLMSGSRLAEELAGALVSGDIALHVNKYLFF